MSAILYKDNPYGGTTSVTDASHVLVTDGSDTVTAQAKFNTQTIAIEKILGNFATIEASTTASKAYNIGDYLVLNSTLYRATSAIAAGGTINTATGGNVVKTTAGQEFRNANFPISELTKAQYNALPEATKNDGTIYMITDDDGGWEAELSSYDNVQSGLTAGNVQDAIDQLSNLLKVTTISDNYQLTNFNANNNTIYSGASVTVPAGTYILIANTQISACQQGQRQGITITTNNTSGNFSQNAYNLVYQPTTLTGVNQYYNVVGIVSPTAQTTYYAMIFNGVCTASAYTVIVAIKIA